MVENPGQGIGARDGTGVHTGVPPPLRGPDRPEGTVRLSLLPGGSPCPVTEGRVRAPSEDGCGDAGGTGYRHVQRAARSAGHAAHLEQFRASRPAVPAERDGGASDELGHLAESNDEGSGHARNVARNP